MTYLELTRHQLIERAKIATAREDWPSVIYFLQQLLLQNNYPLAIEEIETVIDLASIVLERGDFQERWDIAKIFPKLGKEAIAPLIAVLENDRADLNYRWFAARILGEFDFPEAIVSLSGILNTSEDEDLVEIAARSLANLGKSAVKALAESIEQNETRLLATRALAQILSTEAIDPLLKVVTDPNLEVRSTAIEALSSFRDPRIPPILIAGLKDLAASVRKAAAIGLGARIDLAEELDLLQHLAPMLYDFNLEVCQQAAIAISKIKDDAAAAVLFEVLQSPHTPEPLQISLIQSLAWMETPSSLSYLDESLSTVSAAGVLEIICVLGRIEASNLQTQANSILLDFFTSANPAIQTVEIKQALAHAWGQLAKSEAVEALQQLATDAAPGVRLHAIASLKRLGGL
jgi:HEAT repeat protein